jgi:hypothetical protein
MVGSVRPILIGKILVSENNKKNVKISKIAKIYVMMSL